jgi:hypothetical protein
VSHNQTSHADAVDLRASVRNAHHTFILPGKLFPCLHNCRYMGLDCHLILHNSERMSEEDPGLVGNLLVERLQGAYIHQVHSTPLNTEDFLAMYCSVHASENGAGFEGRLREAWFRGTLHETRRRAASTRQEAIHCSSRGQQQFGHVGVHDGHARDNRPKRPRLPVLSHCYGVLRFLLAREQANEYRKHCTPFCPPLPVKCIDARLQACGSGATLAGVALANHLTGVLASPHVPLQNACAVCMCNTA